MNERVDILAESLFMESVYCMSRYTLVFKDSYRKMETCNLNGLIHLDRRYFLPPPLAPEMGVLGLLRYT